MRMARNNAIKLLDPQQDEFDLRILRELQDDGRLSNVELANRIGLSPAPCLRRMRALERSGVIRKYVALLDAKSVGHGVTVFVQVRVNLQLKGRFEVFEEAVLGLPEVLDCYLMSGDADYLLRVVVPSVEAYDRLLSDWLRRVEGITEIKSSFGLKQVKYSTAFPLGLSRRSDRARPLRRAEQPEAWQRPKRRR
jgi:Lrp/AsnC family leucine-responsive transcriptional regulator